MCYRNELRCPGFSDNFGSYLHLIFKKNGETLESEITGCIDDRKKVEAAFQNGFIPWDSYLLEFDCLLVCYLLVHSANTLCSCHTFFLSKSESMILFSFKNLFIFGCAGSSLLVFSRCSEGGYFSLRGLGFWWLPLLQSTLLAHGPL